MLYSDDVYNAKLRASIFDHLDYLTDQNEQASYTFEQDLQAKWFQLASENAGEDPLETPFDASLLLQGYDYIGQGAYEVTIGDMVLCPSGHTGGGTPGKYYKSITASGIITFPNEDFTSSDWEDDTQARIKFRDCVSSLALHYAYRFLAKSEREDNFADMRDYWLKQYNEEFDFLLSQNIGYDFNEDGVIDSTEYSKKRYRIQRV